MADLTPSRTDHTDNSLDIDPEVLQDLKNHDQRKYTSLAKQIECEVKICRDFVKPKLKEHATRLKLYNNQRRDKTFVGNPLLFQVHQTLLANLYTDEMTTVHRPRTAPDRSKSEALNLVWEYDREEMELDVLDYIWDFDASFFGRALRITMDFEIDTKDDIYIPVPEQVDPMALLRDPRAVSLNGYGRRRTGAARMWGFEEWLTKQEMKDHKGFFDYEDYKADDGVVDSQVWDARQARSDAQNLNGAWQMYNDFKKNHEVHTYRWFTSWDGKPVMVNVSSDFKRIIRYVELDSNRWPASDRALYPLSWDWDGVSVPDLVEDKQRATAQVMNLGLGLLREQLYPTTIYDTDKIPDQNKLRQMVSQRYIGAESPNATTVFPVNNANVNWQAVDYITNVLTTAAEKASATSQLQQGQIETQKRTATELSLAARNTTTRYSLSTAIFGWSEKSFANLWFYQYKKHFSDGVFEKVVRLNGLFGDEFRGFHSDDFVFARDPDVKVESKAVADMKRREMLMEFQGFASAAMQDPTSNRRFILRRLGELQGVSKQVIDMSLPKTASELQAEAENIRLRENEFVPVNETDDHIAHKVIHMQEEDPSPAMLAHIQATLAMETAMIANPGLFPASEQQAVATGTTGEGGSQLVRGAQQGGATPTGIAMQSSQPGAMM